MRKIVRIIMTFDPDKFNELDDHIASIAIAKAIGRALGNEDSYISTTSELVITHDDENEESEG